MSRLLVLHEYAPSGNCYKIRLTAAHLGIALERRHYDILKSETRTPGFMGLINAAGRIPVLEIEIDGSRRFLPESNAACFYLADGSPLVPADRWDRADMLRWMFWEQYNHEPNIATLRFWRAYVGEAGLSAEQREMLPVKEAGGAAALRLMDGHLAGRDWFAGDGFSLADIALYAYTHVAEEGGFDLTGYPAVGRWLARAASLPGHVPITA